jgi:hypothetical protein
MLQAIRSAALLCLLIQPVSAFAQTPSLDDKVKYLLEISDTGKVMDAAFEGFRPMMIDQLRKISNKVTPEVADHIANIAADEMNNLKPEFMIFAADVYKKEWSEEEIGALYDFYKSPVGSRVGRKMATFTQNMIPQVQAFMGTRLVPKIQARLAKDERLRKVLSP